MTIIQKRRMMMGFQKKNKEETKVPFKFPPMFSDIMKSPVYFDTGLYALNYILTSNINEGFALNKIFEISGPESNGKSSLGYNLISIAQQAGYFTCLVDSENAMTVQQARRCNIDEQKLIYQEPRHVRIVFSTLAGIINTLYEVKKYTQPLLIIWDSIAAASLYSGLDSFDSKQKGTLAAEMSLGLNRLNDMIANYPVTLIGLNQLRWNIAGWQAKEDSCGGRALKFYSASRIAIRKFKDWEAGSKKIGMLTKAIVIKNKLGTPWRTCTVPISFQHGVESAISNIDLALSIKIMVQKGPYISWMDENKHKAEWAEDIKNNKELRDKLATEIQEHYSEDAVELLDDEEREAILKADSEEGVGEDGD